MSDNDKSLVEILAAARKLSMNGVPKKNLKVELNAAREMAREEVSHRLRNFHLTVGKLFENRADDLILATFGLKKDGFDRIELTSASISPVSRIVIDNFVKHRLPAVLDAAWDRIVPDGKIPDNWVRAVQRSMESDFERDLKAALRERIRKIIDREVDRLEAEFREKELPDEEDGK